MAIRQTNDVAPAAEASAEDKANVVAEQTTQVETVKTEAKVETAAQAEPAAETQAQSTQQEAAEATAAEQPAAGDRAAASAAVLEEEEELPEEAAKVAEPAPTAVAQASTQTTAMSTTERRNALMEQIQADLAEQGFEGVELDYSSFLNITLNKVIETSEKQELANDGFDVRLAGSRLKYCFRNNNPVEDEVEVAYSYDANAHQDPESEVYKKIKEWKEEGLDLGDIKTYTEVLAVMLDDRVEGDQKGELNGKLVTIQVPPTSKGRWGGYLAQLKMSGIKDISSVKTRVRRGKKVESGKFPFYPWDFVNKGKLDLDA